ncbi:VOC family protein [Actinomycetota bacterium Odt1-20B]
MKISNTPSAPCWADLSTTDPAAARDFYGTLFGWDCAVAPEPEAGGYGLFKDERGAAVGGVGPVMDPGRPASWLPYFQCDGVDAVVARVTGNGGQTLAGPMPVLEQGFMAVCADPGGAVFGLWEPKNHPGFGAVNSPGSFCWFELATRDTAGAKDFYQSVFGWGDATHPFTRGEHPGEYTEWSVAGDTFGGMLAIDGTFPPDVPPHWLVYVAVDDCDAAAVGCTGLGGSVLVEPATIDPGRFAVLADPQGAVFAVLAYAGQQPPVTPSG